MARKSSTQKATKTYKDDKPDIKYNYQGRRETRKREYLHVPLERAADLFAAAAQADNTSRSYELGVEQYLEFCREHGFLALPGDPQAIRLFLTHLVARKGLKTSTVQVRFAAIRRWYRDQVGAVNVATSDYVLRCFQGILRSHGEPAKGAMAMGAAEVRRVVRGIRKTMVDDRSEIRGLRDIALVLVTYAGAFRRSEVASLLREDVVFEEEGVRVFLRRSKTDQQGRGTWVGIGMGRRKYTCPVRALRAWLDASPGCEYVFVPISRMGEPERDGLQPDGVGEIIKGLVVVGGLDPDLYSAHSLRAGITTDLNEAGLSTALVQERTRHKSASMINRYHRPRGVLRINYTRRGGL